MRRSMLWTTCGLKLQRLQKGIRVWQVTGRCGSFLQRGQKHVRIISFVGFLANTVPFAQDAFIGKDLVTRDMREIKVGEGNGKWHVGSDRAGALVGVPRRLWMRQSPYEDIGR